MVVIAVMPLDKAFLQQPAAEAEPFLFYRNLFRSTVNSAQGDHMSPPPAFCRAEVQPVKSRGLTCAVRVCRASVAPLAGAGEGPRGQRPLKWEGFSWWRSVVLYK